MKTTLIANRIGLIFIRLNFIIYIVFFGLIATSCSDDDDSNESAEITDTEAQEILKSSLVDQGGLIFDIQATVSTLANNTSDRPTVSNIETIKNLNITNCNQSISVNYENSNTVGNRTWVVQSNWEWTLICDAENNSVSYNLNGLGTLEFDGPNLSKDISKTHEFLITGIEPATDFWLYNASHTREGVVQMNVGNQNSLTTTLTYGSTDLVISKATEQIVSGTFEINFVALNSNGNSLSRGATLVFNGNQTGTVTLNNGVVFDVSW